MTQISDKSNVQQQDEPLWRSKYNTPSGTPQLDSSGMIPESLLYANYWKPVAGTPTWVSNTSFTITDTANANLYNLKYGRTTILKWTDTAVTKMAMVVNTSFGSNTVTITIMGDTLTAAATMSTMTFAKEKCRPDILRMAGTLANGNDLTAKLYMPCGMKPFGSDAHAGTAGATSATTVSISKNQIDGTASILAADISIAAGAIHGKGYAATSGTTLAEDDFLTINITGTSATTPPKDLYVSIFMMPLNNQYL